MKKFLHRGITLIEVMTLLFLVGIIATIVIHNKAHPWKCVSESTVMEILSVHYSDATFLFANSKIRILTLFANGETHVLDQATVAVGGRACIKWERE